MHSSPAQALIRTVGLLTVVALGPQTHAQSVVIDTTRYQAIDGFGAHQGGAIVDRTWWQQLYYDDMQCSMYRVDLTPRFRSPYSDLNYVCPWFGNPEPLRMESSDGPESNRVRMYTNATDYTRAFGGHAAPIAVMGPNIDSNVTKFDFSDLDGAITAGETRRTQLGDFKLVASIWSPAPWVKVSSGNTYDGGAWPLPVANAAWPFIWGGNFAGGKLDVSGAPLAAFNDGTGPTSALTQYARSTAAYVRGFQNAHNARFYAMSIQNELNFEEFYNSCTFPLSSQYLTALKAIRAEFDKYDDLRGIKLMGPEDLMGGDIWGMWQYGGGATTTHKNLQYLQSIAADPAAASALDFFCIHGYASDGVSSAGASPTLWNWWTNGWTTSPTGGIPANVKGITGYGKKSWMTETSGEPAAWLSPATGFPNQGAFSVAMKIQQALTAGMESAWLYWTFAEGATEATVSALADTTNRANSPKYVAAKHFFRFIRPGAHRVGATVTGSTSIDGSAFVHGVNGTLTVVLLNLSSSQQSVTVTLPSKPAGITSLARYTSSNNSYWQSGTVPVTAGSASVTIPSYGIVTLVGQGVPQVTLDRGPRAQGFRARGMMLRTGAGGVTEVSISAMRAGHASIILRDMGGRTIARLFDGSVNAGAQSLRVNTGLVPHGVYLLETGAPGVRSRVTVAL